MGSSSRLKNERGNEVIQATHGAATHIGQVRQGNEDAYVAIDGLYVVADGMGGHSAGEVASALAVTTLKDAYLSTNPGLHTPDQVAEAVALANTAVFIEALEDSSKSGMGTTLTGVVVTDSTKHEIVIANVGDSRTYLWRNGELRQITKDHSHVQTLVDRGAITQREARTHYQRNIVLRAVGIDSEVHVDLFPLTVEDGDRFIMCSDGLVDEADDDEIINEIRLQSQPQDLAERLVQLANDNGGRDNITVVVVDLTVTHQTDSDNDSDNDSDSTVVDKKVVNQTDATNSVTESSTETDTATHATNVTTSEPSTSISRSRVGRFKQRLTSLVHPIVKHRRAPLIAVIGSVIAVLAVVISTVIAVL